MSTHQTVDAVEHAGDHDATEQHGSSSAGRRNLITALLGAAGLGVAALGVTPKRAEIRPDPTPRLLKPTPGATGTSIEWVTSVGQTPDYTNVNLRALDNTNAPRLVVALGFDHEADGGGGVFEWDSTGGTDDGGTVIVPGHSAPMGISATGSTGGCWRRVYSGPIDVRWFGCKCDGSDDTDAFRMALRAIPTGGQLVISGMMTVRTDVSGGWNELVVLDKSDFSIVGLNDGCGIKLDASSVPLPNGYMQGAAHGQAMVLKGCSRVQIRGLLFDGSGKETGILGLNLVSDSLIADCVFRDSQHPTISALLSHAGQRNVYRGNRFDNCHNGAAIGFVGQGTDASDQAISLVETNAVFTENIFANSSTGDAALWIGASDSVFSNNIFTNCAIGIAVGANADVIVNEGQPTQRTLYLGVRHITISGNIINNCADCGIREDFASGAVVNCHDWLVTDNIIENTANAAISLERVNDLTISNNTLKNTGPAHGIMCNCTHGTDSSYTISNNRIFDDRTPPALLNGIAIYASPGPRVSALISGNTITGIASSDGKGIWAEGGSGTSMSVTFTDNAVSQAATGRGIFIASLSGAEVSGNRLSSCGTGIDASLDTNTTIAGNIITSCGTAISQSNNEIISVTNNTLTGNQTGVYVLCSPGAEVNHFTFSGNSVIGNGGYPLVCAASTPIHDWIISNNLIENNGQSDPSASGGWLFFLYVANLTITGNVIKNNGHAVSDAGIAFTVCSNVVIANNIIGDDRPAPLQGPGIHGHAQSPDIDTVLISNNNIYGQHGGWGCGILFTTTGTKFKNVAVNGNVIKDCNAYGFYDTGASDGLTISGNQFVDSTYGVRITPSNVALTGNVFQSGTYGVQLDGLGTPEAHSSGNLFVGNTHDFSLTAGARIYSNGDFYDETTTVFGSSSSIVANDGRHLRSRGSSLPTSGGSVGDLMYNDAPAVGGPVGWVCTSPGSWHPFGAIT